ncbi:uncharacterized protein Gefmeso isoform X2 [Anoplolepis gracilipes]|uniref:uncharacterized protein Gefmeso isoform X2 n=1 Tax=Anoplolepis gracilipes TaxID=354296 RepID=UPI003B9DD159
MHLIKRTSTDLVPQLLGMFDELARRGNDYDGEHVVLSSSCAIPPALQKRLSLVPTAHRDSILSQFRTGGDLTKPTHQRDDSKSKEEDDYVEVADITVTDNAMLVEAVASVPEDGERNGEMIEKPMYERRESNGLIPLRYNRRRRNGTGRPLSGSSIASSTSSSSCSNQGNTCTVNPYLASVESLADTCASSQGSADSGVATVSEASCRILNDDNGQRRDSAEEGPVCHRPRYCDPHRNPVERVLLEIVDTEAIYVEHLRQVIQGYLIFWRDDPPSFARQLHLGDLFSNIEDIFVFNRELLRDIERCGLDPVCVANTFIQHNTGFKVYTEYCTNYPRTVSVLTDLMGREEIASAFRERQAALGHALPLGSFLLKPVQRILKYHLLLENLSKEYGADCNSRENEADEGMSAIEAALAAMTGIAKHINAMKRRHEHAVRVQEIQSLLYGWLGPDLTTGGELVAEGRFRMRGAKAPRHAFLFDRMLLLTKKKEDGLLVYKAHIMCSNLMLIESIPGEPLSFHVIPFDNPRLQYTLQARNLEQKREWTLQIKRVILENYNAVIPSHARQLVLQLGQTQQEDDALADKGSAKKHSAPPEYLEKRKQERERRRSETGLRQKLKKGVRKSDTTMEGLSGRKENNEDIAVNDSRQQTLNRSSDVRISKVKDRFTGWRRKSEPGFQSYVCLNHSDEEQKADITGDAQSTSTEIEEAAEVRAEKETQITNLSPPNEAKDNNEQQHATTTETVEEIVGHILMQNQEFQKLLEKQRTNSIINVRQQRFNKRISADTSDESDSENANYIDSINNNNNNRLGRTRATHREQRLIRTNNAWNSLSSATAARENQQPLQLFYDNLKTVQKSTETIARNSKVNHVHEKRTVFETFKRQSIVTESKVIKTALRIRDNSTSTDNEEILVPSNHRVVEGKEINSNVMAERMEKNESERCNDERSDVNDAEEAESRGFGNYDNLQHVWEGLQTAKDIDNGNDSPTQPAVWLTKLCEDLPTSPPKCGSLPRSFQMSPNSQPTSVTKSRFLQRDGKPMSERPFTIASDKPAEINLEDMERYASTCQPEGRIAKFPMPATSTSSSSSTFFCSLEDTRLTDDAYSDVRMSTTDGANIHPDHKIYRANGSGGSTIFRNVLFKASSRLQGRLRNTMSTETLESNDELERTRYFRSFNVANGKCSKKRTKQAKQHAKELSSDAEELVGCSSVGSISDQRVPQLYYKQGSSSLGARIAQSDYADPTILFAESKRIHSSSTDVNQSFSKTDESEERDHEEEEETNSNKDAERRESETDSFYERSFETIENYADADVDEVFRDSAIFSDVDEVFVMRQPTSPTLAKMKIAPPIPAKRKQETSSIALARCKPSVAQKPDYLKIKSVLAKGHVVGDSELKVTRRVNTIYQSRDDSPISCNRNSEMDRDDVSAGQSQAGWVRKIVGQLQGHIET